MKCEHCEKRKALPNTYWSKYICNVCLRTIYFPNPIKLYKEVLEMLKESKK